MPLGMVNHVVPLEKLEEATRWLARRIAINSLYALKISKMSINQAADIMGQSAAVRASGNFWLLNGERGREDSEPDSGIHDRVDRARNRNTPFNDMDERPW